MNGKRIRNLIFDLDDTLYPEVDFVLSGFRSVAEYIESKTGICSEILYNFMLHQFFKGNRKYIFNEMINFFKLDLKLDDLIRIYRYHKPIITLFPDAVWLLNYSKDRFLNILMTDGFPKVQRNKINVLGIEDSFDYIQINDVSVGLDKTKEIVFLKLLEKTNINPYETVFIGDNPLKDIFIPQKMGMIVFLIKRRNGIYKDIEIKNKKPNFIINSLKEIVKFLED